MKCINCGHINENAITIDPIEWEDVVSDSLMIKLSTKFTQSKGDGFRTLFLSAIHRDTIKMALGYEASRTVNDVFKETVLPALETIDANFEILGHLQLPSSMPLARVDLFIPSAVFTFVTVKDTPELESKLAALGLSSLLNEGSCSTLGDGKNILGL